MMVSELENKWASDVNYVTPVFVDFKCVLVETKHNITIERFRPLPKKCVHETPITRYRAF